MAQKNTAVKSILPGKMNCLGIHYINELRGFIDDYDPLEGYQTPDDIKAAVRENTASPLIKLDSNVNKFIAQIIEQTNVEFATEKYSTEALKNLDKNGQLYAIRLAAVCFKSSLKGTDIEGSSGLCEPIKKQYPDMDKTALALLSSFVGFISIQCALMQMAKPTKVVKFNNLLNQVISYANFHNKDLKCLCTLMFNWSKDNINPPKKRMPKEKKEEEKEEKTEESNILDEKALVDF